MYKREICQQLSAESEILSAHLLPMNTICQKNLLNYGMVQHLKNSQRI
jgi:hypothetical protein